MNPTAKPPYGTMARLQVCRSILMVRCFRAPVCFLAEILDGLSHTIFMIETIDEAASRWTVGKEATLVGLPQKSSPTGKKPQAPYNFLPRPAMTTTFGEDSGVAQAGVRTFLSYDFSPTGTEAGKYEDPGFAKTPPAYGPSSCIRRGELRHGRRLGPSAVEADRRRGLLLHDHEE